MHNKRILLTGAAGGIGNLLARLLLADGARLCLTDVNREKLETLRKSLHSDAIATVAGDIGTATDRARIVKETLQHSGGIDVLINAAGINPFGIFAEQDDAIIQKTMEINAIGPMLMTRAVLPAMLAQNSGHIVNIGSTFGSIGFAWFSAYSASKFALRGFSQSLRRELAETGIEVTYIAPRAVRTAINSQEVYDMANAVKMNMDEPEVAAKQIMTAIRQRKKECHLGFPESMFVRINAIFPGLVDRATRTQNREARKFATRNS
jgi:short-subunit dehydrogenase